MALRYMDNNKDDNYYLDKILHCIDRIITSMNDVSYEEYCENVDLQEITMFNLIQISENAKKLSDEYRNKYTSVVWNDVYGLRNKIVHDYGSVILDIVYDTLICDIPDLKKKLKK